jgi:hypothetical protein
MTVATGTRLDQAGDGTTTEFFPTFWAKSETAFTIVLEIDADGTKVDQSINTHYTVAFAEGTSGVPTVTMLTAPPAGYTIRIVPLAVISQTNPIGSTSPLFGSSVEKSEDELTAILQSLSDRIDQCLQAPQDDPSIDNLGDWKDRLDKYLFFNEVTGQPEMRDLAVVQADLGMLDPGLAEIAALTPSNDDIIQTKAGAYVSRSMVELAIDLMTEADNGTVALPGIAFAADPDTGIYRIGANSIGITTAGALALGINANGQVTAPLSTAFLAYAASDILNVTGAGTVYVMQYGTEVHDRNADYDDTTGIMTAEVAGLYDFSGSISLLELGAATSILVELVTTNRTYRLAYIAGADDVSNATTINWSVVGADMDAAETAKVQLTISGITDVVDIDGGADARTWFSGRLVA